MIEEGLVVSFVGQDGNLKKTLAGLQKDAKDFKKALETATSGEEFANINRQLDNTKKQMQALGGLGVKPMGDLKKGTKEATTSLIDFSRIIQDMPYGIQGVANNIDPWIGSFQRLRTETGSTKAALASMVSGLMGPAGIALGVSAATSLLVVFGDRLKDLVTTSKQAKLSLSGIFDDAAKSAGGELVRLEVYRKKLNDLSIPEADRVRIAKEYNQVADQTNQIDLKQINNLSLLNKKIEEQNNLIKQRALSTAALSRLTAASDKLIEQELEFKAALTATGLTEKQVADAAATNLQKQMQSTQAVRKGLDGVGVSYQNLRQPINEMTGGVGTASSALISLYNQMRSGRLELDKLTDSLKGFITVDGLTTKGGQDIKLPTPKKSEHNFFDKFFDFNPNGNLSEKQRSELMDAANSFSKEFGQVFQGLDFYTSDKPALDVAKAFWADFQKGIILFKPVKVVADLGLTPKFHTFDAADLKDLNKRFLPDFKKTFIPPDFSIDSKRIETLVKYQQLFANIGKSVPKNLQVAPGLSLPTDSITDLQTLIAGLQNSLNEVQTRAQYAAETIKSSLAPAFQNMFSAIEAGEAPLQAFFGGLGQSVKQLMQQLAIAAAQAAVLALVFPGGLATAGGGVVKGFSGFFKNIMGFANGGIIQGPTLGLMGEYAGARNNPEVVAPLNKLRSLIAGAGGGGNVQVSGVLRGNDMILQNARTGRTQRRNR